MSQLSASDFSSDTNNQPIDKIRQVLSFEGSPYRSLMSYFLKQSADQPESAASDRDLDRDLERNLKDSNSDSLNRHSDSDCGDISRSPYLPNNQPTPAEKETFLMSNTLNNSTYSDRGHSIATAVEAAAAETIPTYFTQSVCEAPINQEPGNANQPKTAINDRDELAAMRQEMAQMQAELTQALKAQAVQAVEINHLRATVEAQNKTIGESKGALWALETSVKESTLRQSTRMDSFEQSYQRDRLQTNRLQQAKNEQLEARLEGMVDPMLTAAVEKAIRLLRRDGRRVPLSARQPSTPSIDHLYDSVSSQNRVK